jgi:4-hydroxy-tetrahydrodipicolinate synthase
VVLPAEAIVVALLTPFDEHGAVDRAALGAHVAWLIECGVDGFMPCGTTGETALLSDDEVVEVVATVVTACSGRLPVIAHVGRPATRATIALGERALAAGAAAVSAVVPYYHPLDAGQICTHYRALLDAFGGDRVLAYTIPSHAGNDLDAATVRTLAEAGLAGLKDSTQSLERHREYRAATGPGFALLTGTSTLLLEALRGGSAGAVLGIANLHPEACLRVRDAHRAGDAGAAETAQAELARAQEAAPALPLLKQQVAERLRAEARLAYAPELRAPLGPFQRR